MWLFMLGTLQSMAARITVESKTGICIPALCCSQLVVSFLLVLIAAGIATTAALVVLRHDRGTDALNLLVLLFDLLCIRLGVRVEPRLPVLERVHDLFLFL